MRKLILVLGILALFATPVLAWEFAVIGDTRGNPKGGVNEDRTEYLDRGINVAVLADLARTLRKERVDFVIVLGDLVSKWKKYLKPDPERPGTGINSADLIHKELGLWLRTWKHASHNLPMCPIRGNHEAKLGLDSTPEDMAAVWRHYFPWLPRNGPEGAEGLTYSIQHKSVLIVALDEYLTPDGSPGLSSADLEWLDDRLSRSKALHKIVLGHVPAFPSTDPVLPDIQKALPSPHGEIEEGAQDLRDNFWDLLGANGVRIYFAAHEHLYARGLAEDAAGHAVRQLIVGAGGAPLDPYPQLLYVENYDVTDPDDLPQPLVVPRVLPEAEDIDTGRFGYLLVEVRGPMITARFKAKDFSVEGAEYEVVDAWRYCVRHFYQFR